MKQLLIILATIFAVTSAFVFKLNLDLLPPIHENEINDLDDRNYVFEPKPTPSPLDAFPSSTPPPLESTTPMPLTQEKLAMLSEPMKLLGSSDLAYTAESDKADKEYVEHTTERPTISKEVVDNLEGYVYKKPAVTFEEDIHSFEHTTERPSVHKKQLANLQDYQSTEKEGKEEYFVEHTTERPSLSKEIVDNLEGYVYKKPAVGFYEKKHSIEHTTERPSVYKKQVAKLEDVSATHLEDDSHFVEQTTERPSISNERVKKLEGYVYRTPVVPFDEDIHSVEHTTERPSTAKPAVVSEEEELVEHTTERPVIAKVQEVKDGYKYKSPENPFIEEKFPETTPSPLDVASPNEGFKFDYRNYRIPY